MNRPTSIMFEALLNSKASKEISKDHERFRLLLEVTGDGYWEWYPLAQEYYLCDSYYRMLGYSPEEFPQDYAQRQELIHPDDLEMVNQSFNLHLDNNQGFISEYRLKTKSGSYIWVSSRGRVVERDPVGNVIKMVGIHTDITQRKLAEEKLANNQRFLSTLISNLPGFVYRCKNNPDWEMEYISDGIYPLTGYKPDDLIDNKDLTFNEIINSEYRQHLWDTWQELLNDQSRFLLEEYTITTADGRVRWVWEQGRGVYSPEGELLALEGFITDITDRKIAEENLYTEKELLRITLESIGDGVITTDNQANIVMLNQVAQDLTGWRLADAVGNPAQLVFNLIDQSENIINLHPVYSVLQSGENIEHDDRILLSKQAIYRAVAYNASPIKDSDGKIQGVVLVFRDITEEKERKNDIIYLSYHDGLTGLYNRSFFEEALNQMDAAYNYPLSIIMGDVNGLKMINDVYGHQQGDHYLITLANIFRMACRNSDIIARWGGDEFIILLPNTDGTIAHLICEQIREKCNQTGNDSLHMSIALGYATKMNASEDISPVLKEAEDAMYKAKLLERKSLRSTIITSMKKTLYERSHETEEHAERLAQLSRSIGQVMGLPPDQLNELELFGTLHDIGKVAIKDSILTKPGDLTSDEWLEMKKHPEIGYRIALGVPELAKIAEYILCHHERWDGKGYPQGLSGIEIPLPARILAVVDTFDAITNNRPYRPGRSRSAAVEELVKNAGIQFDPEVVQIFIGNVL